MNESYIRKIFNIYVDRGVEKHLVRQPSIQSKDPQFLSPVVKEIRVFGGLLLKDAQTMIIKDANILLTE